MAAPSAIPSRLEVAIWCHDQIEVERLLKNARHEDYRAHVNTRSACPHSCIVDRHTAPAPAGPAVHALINSIGPSGESPLQLAARLGHTKLVRRLVEAGADLRIRDREGWRGLYSMLPFLRSDTATLLRALEVSANAEEKDLHARFAALQSALATLPDFRATLTCGWTTWVPLLGRILPSDNLTVTKRGCGLRVDFSLAGLSTGSSGAAGGGSLGGFFTMPSWKRGRMSFILTPPQAEGGEAGRLWIVDWLGHRAADITLSDSAERRLKRMHHLGQLSSAPASAAGRLRTVAQARQHRKVAAAVLHLAARASSGEGPLPSPVAGRLRAGSAWWWQSHAAAGEIHGGEAEGSADEMVELATELDLEHAALHLVSSGHPNVETWSRDPPVVQPQLVRARSRMAGPVNLLRTVLNRVRTRSRGGSTEELERAHTPPHVPAAQEPFISPPDSAGMIQATTSVGAFSTCKVWSVTGMHVVVQARPPMQKGAVEEWEAAHCVRSCSAAATGEQSSATGQSSASVSAAPPPRDAGVSGSGTTLSSRLPGRRTLASLMSGWMAGEKGGEMAAPAPALPTVSTLPTPHLDDMRGPPSPAASTTSSEAAGELTVAVPAREMECLTCPLQTGEVLTWSLALAAHDITLWLDWIPGGAADASSPSPQTDTVPPELAAELEAPITIREAARMRSDTGNFTAPCAGTVTVSLDNTASILVSKRVWISLDVAKPSRAAAPAGLQIAQGVGSGEQEVAHLSPEDSAVEQERTALTRLLAHASGTHITGSLFMSKSTRGNMKGLEHHPLATSILDGCGLKPETFSEYFKGSTPSSVREAYGIDRARLPDSSTAVFVTPPPSRTLSRTLHATVASAPHGMGPACVPTELALPAWMPVIQALATTPALYHEIASWLHLSFPSPNAGFPVAATFPVMPALGMGAVLQVTSVRILNSNSEDAGNGQVDVPGDFQDATEDFITEEFFAHAPAL